MPEGVECLVVAESLQQWCKKQDPDNNGSIGLELEEIIDEVVVRNSPIPFSQFDECYDRVNYPKIATFGKTIFIPATNGYCLSAQLGMTGNFSDELTDHSKIHFTSDFSNLYYNDIRKFGHLMLFEKKNIPRNIKNLLKNSIDWRNQKAPELFAKRVRKRKSWQNSEIKTILLISARVDPRISVKDLPDEILIEIIKKCQEIMHKSHAVGGMTIYNFENFGKKGFGRSQLNVYNKRGIGCRECNAAIIQRIKQDNRSTFYCPRCQRGISECLEEKKSKT